MAPSRRFIEAGAEANFIRIRGLDLRRNLGHFVAYLELMEAIAAGGVRAVADSADYFGGVANAAGADAMAAGTRYFRTVTAALLPRPADRPDENSEDGEHKVGWWPPLHSSIQDWSSGCLMVGI